MNKILIELPEREKGVEDILSIMFKARLKNYTQVITIEQFHDLAQLIYDYFQKQEIGKVNK